MLKHHFCVTMSGNKRKFDGDEDDGYREFRPREKRQRVPPVVSLSRDLTNDLNTIGESPQAFEQDIQFLSEPIVNEFEGEEYFRNALLNTLLAITLEQPHKIPAIGLLTLAVNGKDSKVGGAIVKFFTDKAQEYADASVDENFKAESNETGPWNKLKLILRFLSVLSPMINEDDIVALYKKLFDLAIELNNSAAKRVPLAEAIYTNLLVDIPYLFNYNTSGDLMSKVDELLSNIETQFQVKSTVISLTKQYIKDSPYEIRELVQLALPAVKNVLANNCAQLRNLFTDNMHLLPQEQGDIHTVDILNLPSPESLKPFAGLDRGFGSVDSMWKTPRYNFQVYLANPTGNFETVAPIQEYPGFLFDDVIIDIVESMEFNRKEVARQLLTLDLFFKDGAFAKSGTSLDQLISLSQDHPELSTYKIEDIAVEKVLALIFKLPTVSQSFAYFYTLLVEICNRATVAIAPVFGRAIRFFYHNMDLLDFELRLRFLDWVSIQLSNFNFTWKWTEWEQDAELFDSCVYNPKLVFIKNLIHKELRLTSTPDKVDDSLTEVFAKYLNTDLVPRATLLAYYQTLINGVELHEDMIKNNNLLFINETLPCFEDAKVISELVHKPLPEDHTEITTALQQFQEKYGHKLTVVFVVQAVLYAGNRSLSHASKYIASFKPILTQLLNNEETVAWCVEAIVRYWNSNPQNAFLILDLFRSAGLVSIKSILSFSFDESVTGINYGLIEATSVESTFRILTDLSLRAESNVEVFEYVFETLCKIAVNTASQLNGNIVAPRCDLSKANAANAENLPAADLQWKYETTMAFIKSILRKYSDEYVVLLEKFRSGINVLGHEPTQQLLLQWFDEMKEL